MVELQGDVLAIPILDIMIHANAKRVEKSIFKSKKLVVPQNPIYHQDFQLIPAQYYYTLNVF